LNNSSGKLEVLVFLFKDVSVGVGIGIGSVLELILGLGFVVSSSGESDIFLSG
jgi:hypothetical protein